MKITPKAAGKALGISEQAVRIFLQQGKLPFGAAVKMPGSSVWTYVIYPKKFAEYVADFDGVFVKETENE